MSNEILLETGTNELEVLEFFIGTRSYVVNALKIKQLIQFREENIVPVPNAHASVMGTILFQGEAISVVDLHHHFNIPREKEDETQRKILMFCEFNDRITAYAVDRVNRIYRISWNSIQSISENQSADNAPTVTGVVVIDDRQLMMLDFEKINGEIFSSEMEETNRLAAETTVAEDIRKKRARAFLFFAEDSVLYRETIARFLANYGYSKIKVFNNGGDPFKILMDLDKRRKEGEDISFELPQVLITDIEMPQMDGLTLCKNLKALFPQIFVIVVSSLISVQMIVKCEGVGADANFIKKDVAGIVAKMDELLLS
jgi:two-component system chemotaxis response regulator CheV